MLGKYRPQYYALIAPFSFLFHLYIIKKEKQKLFGNFKFRKIKQEKQL